MFRRPPLHTVATFVAAALCACADSTTAPRTAASSASTVPPLSLVSTASTVLYSQYPTPTSGWAPAPCRLECADDFTVPAGEMWTLTGVRMGYFHDANTQTFDVFRIYADENGGPGGLSAEMTNITSAERNDLDPDEVVWIDYDFTLTTSVVLTPGTYWMGIRSNGMSSGLMTGPGGPLLQRSASDGSFAIYSTMVGYYPGPATGLDFWLFGAIETPPQAIVRLQGAIADMDLRFGTENSMEAKLRAALAALNAGDAAGACGPLLALMNFVEAQRGKALTQAEADMLRTELTRIRTTLVCGDS